MEYIIIDEMSMVGRKLFGCVDTHPCQAFPYSADRILGECLRFLSGDFGQLPPVMDLPLYTLVSRSSLSDLGRTAYQQFDKVVVLDQVMRQSGHSQEQVLFCNIHMHLRDALLTTNDW